MPKSLTCFFFFLSSSKIKEVGETGGAVAVDVVVITALSDKMGV